MESHPTKILCVGKETTLKTKPTEWGNTISCKVFMFKMYKNVKIKNLELRVRVKNTDCFLEGPKFNSQ